MSQTPLFPDSPAARFTEVDELPPLRDLSDGQLLSISLSNNTTGLTHGLHRFPAKFIPQIPRWALREFAPEGGCVLDPFTGSATTLVEALTHPVTALGLGIDPLTRLIGAAKTAPPPLERLVVLGEQLRTQWRPRMRAAPPMAGVKKFDHWFSPAAQASIHGLLDAIDSVCDTEAEQRFHLVLLSAILRRVSNADDQSQKTYVSGTNPKSPRPVEATFWRQHSRALKGVAALQAARNDAASVRYLAGDAQQIPLPDASVDLMVTSPPYLDSVDYMYNMMVEYFWLGPRLGVPTRASFNRMRREPIGAKNPLQNTAMPASLAGRLDHADLAPKRLASASAYFRGMEQHFAQSARCLRAGGTYVLVVGNSRTRTDRMPLHDCLVQLAHDAGLTLHRAFGYRIRRHYMKFPRKGRGGIILVDWILVFKRAEPRGAAPRLPVLDVQIGDGEVAS